MDRKPVGLIGVGAMGRALLARLRRAGLHVKAFDVSEAGRTAARDGGAEVVATAAEAARGAAFIHVIVPADEHVLAVMSGPDGVLAGAEPSAFVLLHSTVLPTTTQKVAAEAAKRGVDLIDAPVTAVPAKFEAGEGQFLVGGTVEQVAKAHDQLLIIGKSVHRFGPLGAGNIAKIAKAMINATQRVALDEILQVASAGGLDVKQFLDFERASGSENCVARWDHVFVVEDNRARPRPVTNLFRKDVFLGEQLAHAYELDAPIAEGSAKVAKVWLKMWDEAAKKKAGG